MAQLHFSPMGRRRVPRWLVLAILCFTTSVGVSYGLITDYTVQSVTRDELASLPTSQWATYNSLCNSRNVTQIWQDTSMMSTVFPTLSPSGISAPFYAWDDLTWYISSMGFLSPTPYGMCNGYCSRRFYTQLAGNYAFSDNASILHDGGGDWPMIALFTSPFGFSRGLAPVSSIVTMETVNGPSASGPFTQYTTLEYCSVPSLQGGISEGNNLTAQAVVFANGTVILRYASVPDTSVVAAYLPSTGLIYSKTLRKAVAAPSATNGIAAYRFDPVVDACGAHTSSSSACTADTGNSCVWCASTSACTTSAFVAQVCPGGQWTLPGTGSGSSSSSSGTATQRYYSASTNIAGGFADYTEGHAYLNLGTVNGFSVMTDWSFKLFGLESYSPLQCFPGFTCVMGRQSNACNPVQGTCPNGNYSRAIMALQSSTVWRGNARAVSKDLGVRMYGDELCFEPVCPAGTAIKMTGLALRNGNIVLPQFTVQLYVDAGGVIDVYVQADTLPSGTPLLAFPGILVGLARANVDDPASVMVPQGLLRSPLHVRFVPVSACGDCGLHGWCDEAARRCECLPGHFGYRCKTCPVCWEDSTCDDGKAGSGQCLCSGGTCALACSNVSDSDTLAQTCGGCDAAGGRCVCGQCVCQPGWSGRMCNVPPEDACREYSFDGCKVCGQHPGCVFCFDSTCFNPALSGGPTGYACSYSTSAEDTQACATYASRGLVAPSSNVYSAIAVGCISAAVVATALISACTLCCACTNRRQNDPMLMFAVGGTPDVLHPHAEREVVQVNFTRGRVPNRGIRAIPLRQVSLQRLFKRRKGTIEAQADRTE